MIANDGKDYLIGECKWRNEKSDLTVLQELQKKADVFSKMREHTWYILFSKSGFTQAVIEESEKNESIILVDIKKIMEIK